MSAGMKTIEYLGLDSTRSRFLGHGYSHIGPGLWSRRWAIAVSEPTVGVVF